MRSVILACLFLMACAGARVRTDVLLPAMEMAWSSIRQDALEWADRTSDAGTLRDEITAMDAAFEAKDRFALIRVNWLIVKAAVESELAEERAIGELGPGVTESLLERVRQFDRAMARMANNGR